MPTTTAPPPLSHLDRLEAESIHILREVAAGFMTPIGYQTNLMIYAPGGYRFTDYVRVGAPLSLVVGMAVLWAIPVFWPFQA